METEIGTMLDVDGVIRHCAYCLQLCGSPTKLCGGCKGDGQRQVNWCRRHECGEEDVDWEVVPIPNKGLGIRAKKFIHAGMKIIVEPVFYSPDGIQDLPSEFNTSLTSKFFANSFHGFNMGDYVTVALRIARVNHSCQPNAATIYDETAQVAILFAQKDIQPEEDISFCYYYPFTSLIPVVHFPGMDLRWNLRVSLNNFKRYTHPVRRINCPTDCPCFDPAFTALNLEGRYRYRQVIISANENKIEEALSAGNKLLDIYRRLDAPWFYRGFMEYLLFQLAVRKSDTFHRGNKYIRSAAEVFGKICPYSEKHTKTYEKLLEHPETDANYLTADKSVSNASSLVW